MVQIISILYHYKKYFTFGILDIIIIVQILLPYIYSCSAIQCLIYLPMSTLQYTVFDTFRDVFYMNYLSYILLLKPPNLSPM